MQEPPRLYNSPAKKLKPSTGKAWLSSVFWADSAHGRAAGFQALKIFHLTTGAPFGGMERQMERLAALLHQEGFEQRVMFAENPVRAGRLAAAGIVPIEMDYPSRFAFLDRRRINSVIRRFAPDIVVSWAPEMAAFVERGNFTHIGRLPPASDVTSLVNCEHLFMPATARGGFAFAAGWSADKVHVIPHLPRADDVPIKPVNRKTYYTPPMAKLIVTAMRLTRDSGLESLLDAVARLSGYYLWVLGDGADRALLESAAHERGVKPRVRFLGWQDDPAPFIAAADVFAYPGRQDDVGDAIIEAWAAGAAVVAADSLGPGLLIKHQENGLLVPVDDVPSMAEAIKWVCQDASLASRLGEAGRLAYRNTYAMDKVAPQYLSLFKQFAPNPAPAMVN